MKRLLVLVLVGAALLACLGSPAIAQKIPFLVIRTIPHGNYYGCGLAWENDTLWISSTGNVIEKVDPYSGTKIKSITPPNSKVRDLTFDGMDLWMASWYKPPTPSIFSIDPLSGLVVGSFVAPFTGGTSDGMGWDGKYLWVGDEANALHQIDRVSMTIVKTIPVPSTSSYNPRGLAWDTGTQTVWAGYQSTALIRQHNPATGAVMGEFTSPYSSFQQGLTWDGWFLWATGGSGTQTISQIDVTMPFMTMIGSLTPKTNIQFALTRADNQANNVFVVGWSGSGTMGFKVGPTTVPLTFDAFTVLGLQLFTYFSMVIDTSGAATTPNFPWPAVPPGIPFWVCGVTLDSSGIVSVCEPIKYISQ
jgi:glutamine cyclotransferase